MRGPLFNITDFKSYLLNRNRSALTVTAYVSDLHDASQFFPGRRKPLSRQDLDAYVTHLRKRDCSAPTIRRRLASLSSYYAFLEYVGWKGTNPTKGLVKPRSVRKIPDVLTEPEVAAMLDLPARTYRERLDRVMAEVLYGTGCRRSEVAGALLLDLDLDGAALRVLGKGNKWREAALTPRAVALLREYLAERPAGAAQLFVHRNGKPRRAAALLAAVKRLARRAGITRRVYTHGFRHAFGVHMLERGCDLRSLQDLLGHASVQTTTLYTTVSHKRLHAQHGRFHPRA